MVVDFGLNDAAGDDGSQQQRARERFLIARSHGQANSIFDYVHLSSTLLRKVHFGQPIELAIQTQQSPAQGKQQMKHKPLDSRSLSSLDSNPKPLQTQQQQQQQCTRQSATALAPTATSSSKYLKQSALATEHQPFIRYNRVVRFQAADGGFLLIESDGCVRKVPKECASDPRTLVALFPCDPVANIAKRPKRVRSGDCAFLVQGGLAALQSQQGIARADSDEMVEGPAHLVEQVMHHDHLAHSSSSRQLRSSHLPLTKQIIRKKQLEQALAPETEAMPTTVWYLAKVAQRTISGPERSAEPLAADTQAAVHFRHGEQCQLFQNQSVVCYELQVAATSDRNRASLVSSGASATLSSNSVSRSPHSEHTVGSRSLQSEPSVSSPTRSSASHTSFSHVWLHDSPQFGATYHPVQCQCDGNNARTADARGWDNTWRICDVDVRESAIAPRAALPTPILRQESAHHSRRSSPATVNSTLHVASPSAMLAVDERSDSDASSSEDDSDQLTGRHDLCSDALRRQASVYDVATFASKAETLQARAARIIVRFFQRLIRDDVTQSRVQDFLRRRRRLTHTERHVTTELSACDQLKLLQCYNPHVYGGSGLRRRSDTVQSPQTRARRGMAFSRFTDSAESDRQRLATIKCDIEHLNRDWLHTERHALQPLSAAAAAAACSRARGSRRPLPSPITPQRIVANRERERQFLVGMKMAKRDAPTFHFGGAATAAVPSVRPRTAPLGALDPDTY